MDLHSVLQSLYDTSLSTSIRQVGILFPAIESVHVIAITVVVGTIAIVDLRLIGYASHRRSANRLIHELLPFTWVAFAAAIISGSLMFASKAVDYAENGPFLWKMCTLVAAGINMGIFHLGIHRRIGEWDETFPVPFAARLAGFLSLVLWIAVVFLGRWIGFTM